MIHENKQSAFFWLTLDQLNPSKGTAEWWSAPIYNRFSQLSRNQVLFLFWPRWQRCHPQGMHGHSLVWWTWKPYQTNATAVWTARSAPSWTRQGRDLPVYFRRALPPVYKITYSLTRRLLITTRNVANQSSWKFKALLSSIWEKAKDTNLILKRKLLALAARWFT